ncbi:NUDIX hydrolase [Aquisalinus flavus]|uniref:NUDIX hydrolase n=1 Tax=Aquisalinus flavus TaxID=1526572 RepID=A0A8J2V2S4_9PROT|nr:NUDIX hydrolase [Aquisalinus flavus]UNE48675.1 NUDIX hydrolase [Aquisalinus flavus]GGD13849.1 NUDIX hydrolase [Aquisalinus flavus]
MAGPDGNKPDRMEPDFTRKVPDGDTVERSVCTRCGFIAYDNPKIVVGSVATAGQRILLCRRAINPRKGYWTLPAGYLEHKETAEDGAMREAREEACATLTIHQLLATYSIMHISQVQLMFRATLENPETIAPGPESEEVGLFEWDDIPWDELAFPSVAWALRHYHQVKDRDAFPPFTNPVEGL